MGRTNIELDDHLVRQGLKAYKCKTKRELVHLALTELLKRAKQKEILALRGQVKWEGTLRDLRESRV
ncbi:MAG: type II toxin-antitoxin system VapB family antitoxin [Nitrospira sp.]|nr:type II toxin-antitoxin system VapB family antitoxin [Nitrospira sp.]